MRAKTIAALLAATAIVGGLAIPVGASAAKPRRSRQEPSVSAQLRLRGTNGFLLDLSTFGSRSVILTASHFPSRGANAAVTYFSGFRYRGSAFAADRLNVRIGRLGHFRGRFVPTSTETEKSLLGCKGAPTMIEKGFFVGSFDFHGERGYTVVHSHRERGTVTHWPGATCVSTPWHESAREATERKEEERNEVRLVAGDEGASVLLQANREEAPGLKGAASPRTTIHASLIGKKAGDFSITYSAVLFGLESNPATSLQTPNLAEPLAEATLTAPAPFSGSATFHLESPKTARWTGDLAVELPGLGKVPLTGGGIAAGICKGPSNCTETLPKNLQPVLEAPGNAVIVVTGSKPHK